MKRTTRSLALAKPGLGLHAMITSGGRQLQTEPGYDWHGLRRGSAPFALIQVTLAGRGMLSYEGRQQTLQRGDVMLLHFPHDNRYWLAAGDRWDFFYLCLNGSEVMRAWHAAVTALGPVVSLPDESPLLQRVRQTCADVIEERLVTPWQISAAAYALAMELLSLAAGPGEASDRRRPPGIARAIQHCHEQRRDQQKRNLTVAQLARVAGYSRCHFARVFARSEGLSPRQFLLNHRLSRAVRLIHTTDQPIKSIAHECGFYDPQHLCRVFRQAYGSTPAAMRRAGMFRAE